jgi:hypothetical protein
MFCFFNLTQILPNTLLLYSHEQVRASSYQNVADIEQMEFPINVNYNSSNYYYDYPAVWFKLIYIIIRSFNLF